jgi:hypothetical protein
MTLIHTALLSEAQTFIEKYKLQKVNSQPKIYANENIVVLIGGIGKENTYSSLAYTFENYAITKALNIGIAGCGDTTIEIGELFCTNRKLEDIEFLSCETVDSAQLPSNVTPNTLYDMEASYFLEIVKKHLDEKDIYVFKIVSDHLDSTIPKKDFVKKLINDKFTQISKYL